MKTMKNLKGLIASAALALAVVGTGWASNGPAYAPRSAGPGAQPFTNPSFIGCKPCRLETTTSAIQCATGSGLLYRLTVYGTGAAPDKGVMAFDTLTASDITAFSGVSENNAITGIVYASVAANSLSKGNLSPLDLGLVPARYEYGLVLKSEDASLYAVACYRPDSGLNP